MGWGVARHPHLALRGGEKIEEAVMRGMYFIFLSIFEIMINRNMILPMAIFSNSFDFLLHYRPPPAFNNLSPSATCNTNASNSSGGSGGRQRHSSNSNPPQVNETRPQNHVLQSNVMFKLPNNVKLRLCKFLDNPPAKGKNDWRALAYDLGMDNYISFFEKQSSPTECVLSLWEVHHQTGSSSAGNPIDDLATRLKSIGRKDVAQVLEKDVGPWV